MNRLISATVGLAALLGAALPAAAGTPTSISKIDWEQGQRIEFAWRADAVPPAWMRVAILGAAEDSNATRGARAAVVGHDAAGTSWFAYTDELPTEAALAYASRRAPDLFRVWLRPHGWRFDWGVLRWCQFYATAPDGCFDAQTVSLHELGHVQGLGHSDNDAPARESVMQPISRAKPRQGWNARAYGSCDIAAMQIRYELLTPATPVSSCLSLATSLTLAASTGSVASGGSVTFSATLRVADDVPHARLAGDPLSARAVALQRRLPGGTSWTTYALMAAGSASGSYRLTVSPSTTYQWRALFSQPDEGVLGDASAMLEVTVAGGCNPYCVE